MKIYDKRMVFSSVSVFRANLRTALDWANKSNDHEVAIWRGPGRRYILLSDNPESYSDEDAARMRQEYEDAE